MPYEDDEYTSFKVEEKPVAIGPREGESRAQDRYVAPTEKGEA